MGTALVLCMLMLPALLLDQHMDEINQLICKIDRAVLLLQAQKAEWSAVATRMEQVQVSNPVKYVESLSVALLFTLRHIIFIIAALR